MAIAEKRREFTDLMRKRIEEANKTKPLEQKQKERVIRKKLAVRERVVVVAKAKAKEIILSRFHKEYVKKPLKVIEREMGTIKERIKYLEGQRKKTKAKGKVTLESNIRALNVRLSVLGNIRKEVLIKSAKSKTNAPTKTPFVHQPEQSAVVRRQGELVRGNSASPKPAKMGIESIQSPKQAISAIDGLVDRVIGTEQSSDMEAANKSLSQFSVGLEAKMNGVFRGFNEKRVSLNELNTYYVSIDSILRKVDSRPDKVIPLGRLELLKKRLERILFPEEKGNGKASVKGPIIVNKVPEAVEKRPEKVPAREPEPAVAVGGGKGPFDVEKALTELRGMLQDVRFNTEQIITKLEFHLSHFSSESQKAVLIEVVDYAFRNRDAELIDAVKKLDSKYGAIRVSVSAVIEKQRRTYNNIIELIKGLRKDIRQDRNKTIQEVMVELQDIARRVEEVSTKTQTEASTRGQAEEILQRLTLLENYFDEEHFNTILRSVTKSANESLFLELSKFDSRFEEIKRDIEGVAKATVRAVRDTSASLETKLQEAKEELLRSLGEGREEDKRQIMPLIDEINKYILENGEENKAVLTEIKNELLELEKFFEKDAFKKYLLEVLETAFAIEQPQLVNAIMEQFEKEYPDLKKLKDRFDAVDLLIQSARDDVKAYVRAKALELLTLLQQIDAKVTPLEPKLDTIAQAINALSAKLDPAALATFLEAALLPGIRNAIEDGNNSLYNDLVAKMGNRFNEIKNQNLNLKKLIIKLSNREEQRYIKIKKLLEGLKDQSEDNLREVIDGLWQVFDNVGEGRKVSAEALERIKKLETFFEKDAYKAFLKTIIEENNPTLIAMMKADPFFADKVDKAYLDAKFKELSEEIKKTKEEETKKPEAKKEEGWLKKVGSPTFGVLGLILVLGIVAYLVLMALQNSGGGPSGGIPSTAVVPVIGETAQAASSGLSSILGPLGGINPIIIILILVALFLLFPKK